MHECLCDYLFRLGLITAEVREYVRGKTEELRVPIGRVLINNGRLRIKQVMTILEEQADNPSLLFGEIAIRQGVLTPAEVDEALCEQASASSHPADILVREKLVDSDKLLPAVVDYLKLLEFQVHIRCPRQPKP